MSNNMRYHAQKQAMVHLMEGYTSPDVINQAVMEDALKDYTSYDNHLQRTIAIWAALNVIKAEKANVFDDIDTTLNIVITIALHEAGTDENAHAAIAAVAEMNGQTTIVHDILRRAAEKQKAAAQATLDALNQAS
jgi:hypothetical protein